jgi:hydroxypyruvate reductase
MSVLPRESLLKIFQAALAAVHGRRVVRAALERDPPPRDRPLYLIAVGKAACAMARGALDALGREAIRDAFVATKRGLAESLPWPVHEAGHPLPDAASLAAGAALEQFVRQLPERAFVLALLSGGASAIVERLPPGVGLEDLRQIQTWLLGSGLDIRAMNAVRRRFSCLKGGGLVRLLSPRAVLRVLAISDVPGDDPAVIGSGPFTPLAEDPPGRGMLAELEAELPPFLRAWLARLPPPPPPASGALPAVHFEIVANNVEARRAAAAAGRAAGYRVAAAAEDPDLVQGDAIEAGMRLGGELLAAPPGVLHIWGGETTVRLPPHPGRGGRCQSLALAAALTLAGRPAVFLAAGTDGQDGPTDVAGALVDGQSVARGTAAGLDAQQALARADAGRFLAASGDLVQTGPTGTNVMDLMLGFRIA